MVAAAVVCGALAYGGYSYRMLAEELKQTKAALAARTADLEGKIGELKGGLSDAQKQNDTLSKDLAAEQGKNKFFEEQIGGIASTVGTLEKLKKLDPELLQKYSKVYFLNENYGPSKVGIIDPKYLSDNEKPILLHAQAYPYLQKLLDAASAEGIPILVLSAYRSFGEQSTLKSNYKFTYGSGANSFSADQGYSEHQLGTTVDFTTPANGSVLSKFESSSAYPWLEVNAHKYGFILSYPKNNTYYTFEPWHWRFVGVELANKLHNEGKFFYDLDQREIDTYLIKIFD